MGVKKDKYQVCSTDAGAFIYLIISTHFAEYSPGTPDVEEGGLEVVSGERGRKSRNFTNSRSTDEELVESIN